MKMYLVGGYIRDKVLGRKSKDIDIAVEGVTYAEMKQWLIDNNFNIACEEPQFFRIKAGRNESLIQQDLKFYDHLGGVVEIKASELKGKYIDFLLTRSDGLYSDGRHPDEVKPASILEDLSRRDLTFNSLALNLGTGELLDPFNGLADLEEKVVKCVGDPNERFREDPLRILRAIRFAVTLNCNEIDATTWEGMFNNRLLLETVEPNRIRHEMNLALKTSTFHTLTLIEPLLISGLIFNKNTGLWLKVTNEQ